MNVNLKTWKEVINRLPGIYPEDQYPEGSNIAVSLERAGEGTWRVHIARDRGEGIIHSQTRPLTASGVYRTLEKLFANVGEPPEFSGHERSALGLPRKEDCFRDDLQRVMPGTWLGSSDTMESEFGWTSIYSVEQNEDGSHSLYTCSVEEGNERVSESDVERVGTYNLSHLLDELRILGFERDRYSFLLSIEADDWEGVRKALPGALHGDPSFRERGAIASICLNGTDRWNLYVAEKKSDRHYSIIESVGLDAKQLYRKCYELFETVPMGRIRRDIHLPSLEHVFSDSVKKKMKGHWLGEVTGTNESGLAQVRFVSLKADRRSPAYGADSQSEPTWELFFIKTEDLLLSGRGHRKFEIHTIGPIQAQDLPAWIERLDPVIDPIDLCEAMQRSSLPEAIELADAIIGHLESGG